MLNTDPKKAKEREIIAPCVSEALNALKPYGEPDFTKEGQHKIELVRNAGEWTLPVIGYIDFIFPKHNLVIDLKTTTRMPSTMSMAHQRQAAIYETAKKMLVKFLYVTPKKHSFLNCDRVADTMKEVKVNLIRQERFLSLSDDKNILAGIVPVNSKAFTGVIPNRSMIDLNYTEFRAIVLMAGDLPLVAKRLTHNSQKETNKWL